MPVFNGSETEISIHALREEGDRRALYMTCSTANFYPRPPRGGRPDLGADVDNAQKFLSTPSARRATQQLAARGYNVKISIHALREEGDHRHRFPQ